MPRIPIHVVDGGGSGESSRTPEEQLALDMYSSAVVNQIKVQEMAREYKGVKDYGVIQASLDAAKSDVESSKQYYENIKTFSQTPSGSGFGTSLIDPTPISVSTANSVPTPTPPIPLTTSTIAPAVVTPPVKTAPIDTVLIDLDEVSVDFMTDLIFEDIGGQELINVARNDTINGQTVSYQPIKNLTTIQQQYNPNNIVSLQNTSDKYFINFPIKLESRLLGEGEGSGPNGAYVYIEQDTGDLIVELINLETDEQIEVQISLGGTIYEAEFNES